MLYPINKVNYIIILKKRRIILWDTQKSIEAEEKWAQKKEELVKEINVNKPLSGRYKSN
tara:strand:- start:112 stop:288 length:177 start_codon:yes stop_codon:yes gene_type:complete